VKGISIIQLMTTQLMTDSKGRRSVSLHRDYIGLRLRVAHRRAITYTHVAPKIAPADVMDHLTCNDYACALGLLAALEAQARQPDRFARACVDAMRAFLPAASIQFDMGERRMPRNRYVRAFIVERGRGRPNTQECVYRAAPSRGHLSTSPMHKYLISRYSSMP
jgi:hypothetical protein